MKLTAKRAPITGAASGIERASPERFACEGADEAIRNSVAPGLIETPMTGDRFERTEAPERIPRHPGRASPRRSRARCSTSPRTRPTTSPATPSWSMAA